MQSSQLFKSLAVVGISILLTACGTSSSNSGTPEAVNDDTTSEAANEDAKSETTNEEAATPNELFPTSGLVDLKDYIPQTDKTVMFSVSDSNVNLNGQATYAASNGTTTVHSTRDGLDLGDYIDFDTFISLNSAYRETQSSMEFGVNSLMYTRDGEQSEVPRFYNNGDVSAMSMDLEYVSDFSATSGSTTSYFTEAYVSDSHYCTMQYLGDYDIFGTQYADAIALECFGNRAKGGSVNGVTTIAYDNNYTSTSILLPAMGIVSVEYTGVDTNYTVTWQP